MSFFSPSEDICEAGHMILHIAPNEKFIKFLIESFDEALPGRNIYLILGKNNYNFDQYKEAGNVRCVSGEYWSTETFLREVNSCDAVIIHYLSAYSARAFSFIPAHIPIVWSGWGGDYYSLMDVQNDIILPETMKLVSKVCKRGVWKKSRSKLAEILNVRNSVNIKDLLYRIDWFSAPIPDDYQLIRGEFPSFRAEYLQIAYGSIEKTFIKGPSEFIGRDVLVGNSADPTNNHVEMFSVISKYGETFNNIIVPLSYGDEAYRDEVIKIGTKMFGDRFVPLIEFLPIEQYYDKIKMCSVVMMNHIRQQALGNVIAALYKGAKVYLNPAGSTYKYLKRCGVVLFDLDNILSCNEMRLSLSNDQIKNNRSILNSIWSEKSIRNNILRIEKAVMSFERGNINK